MASTGGGPDVVLLHGWGLHSGIWAELIPRLASRWRLHGIDLPGHGRSPAAIDLSDLDAVCAELRRAVPPTAVWVGWSLGGLIAQAYALRYPGAATRLILLASQPRFARAPDWPHALPLAVLDAFCDDLAQDSRATLERFLALQVRASGNRQHALRRLRSLVRDRGPAPAALRAGLGLLRKTDLRASLPDLSCPLRVILGECDAVVPARCGPAIAALHPDVRYQVIARAGHAPFLSHVESFARVLETFLDD